MLSASAEVRVMCMPSLTLLSKQLLPEPFNVYKVHSFSFCRSNNLNIIQGKCSAYFNKNLYSILFIEYLGLELEIYRKR